MFSPYVAPPRTPALGKVAKHRGNTFPVAKVLTILAACLGAVFVASIVLEAIDGDLDLWPFGAENFTAAAQGQLAAGGQPFSVSFALNPLLWFVVTIGAHLVMRHRARGALATDRPSIFTGFNVAEPRWQGLNPAPGLGHLFWWAWSECWSLRRGGGRTDLRAAARVLPHLQRAGLSVTREAQMREVQLSTPQLKEAYHVTHSRLPHNQRREVHH